MQFVSCQKDTFLRQIADRILLVSTNPPNIKGTTERAQEREREKRTLTSQLW
jgi:hypothetical protein